MTSEADLRAHLRLSLRKSGLIDDLTAQLRADLVRKFSNSGSPTNAQESNTKKTSNEHNKGDKSSTQLSLEHRAVRSLIINYLQAQNLNHSLSVFVPESRVGDGTLTGGDALKSLGFNENSESYRAILGETVKDDGIEMKENVKVTPSPPSPILTSLLRHLSTQLDSQTSLLPSTSLSSALALKDSTSKSSSENTTPDSLAKQLHDLQTQYDLNIHSSRSRLSSTNNNTNNDDLESKMFHFQKHCEDRAHDQMNADLARYRSHDLDMMRLEEQGNYRNELAALRSEMKATYDLKVTQVLTEEEGKVESRRQLDKINEAAAFTAREKMVRELESVRRREVDSKREMSGLRKGIDIEEKRIKFRALNLEGREEELKRKELGLKNENEREVEKIRADGKKEYAASLESLARQKAALSDEAETIKLERTEITRIKHEMQESHNSRIADHESSTTVRMERDALKVKIAEIESHLNAFLVHGNGDDNENENDTYNENENDSEAPDTPTGIPKLANAGASSFSRQSSFSVLGATNKSRNWRDHKRMLETNLDLAEQEICDLKALNESSRIEFVELRKLERVTFEKAATLEAVAGSLKNRLVEAETLGGKFKVEREEFKYDLECSKKEVEELRILIENNNKVMEIGVKTKVDSAIDKNLSRESRLENARVKAREQMKADLLCLEEDKPQEKKKAEEEVETEKEDKAKSMNVVWHKGRPLAVAWDEGVNGLSLQDVSGDGFDFHQKNKQQDSLSRDAIQALERKLDQAEFARSEELAKRLKSEAEAAARAILLTAELERVSQQQQRQQYQFQSQYNQQPHHQQQQQPTNCNPQPAPAVPQSQAHAPLSLNRPHNQVHLRHSPKSAAAHSVSASVPAATATDVPIVTVTSTTTAAPKDAWAHKYQQHLNEEHDKEKFASKSNSTAGAAVALRSPQHQPPVPLPPPQPQSQPLKLDVRSLPPQVEEALNETSPPSSTYSADTAHENENLGWEDEYHKFLEDEERKEEDDKRDALVLKEKQEVQREEMRKSEAALQERESNRLQQAKYTEKAALEKQQREEKEEEEERRKKAEAEQVEKDRITKESEVEKERLLVAAEAAETTRLANVKSKEEEEEKERKRKDLAFEKKRKEDEEQARWDEKARVKKEQQRMLDEERRLVEEVHDEEIRKEREIEENDRKEKERIAEETQVKHRISATKMQSLHRRNEAVKVVKRKKEEKEASMSKIEKAKFEREKKKAVEDALRRHEEEAKRAEVEKEHQEARERAVGRMRAKAEEEEVKERVRKVKEEEERKKSNRRVSSGGGGSSGDYSVSDGGGLEVSDEIDFSDEENNDDGNDIGVDDDW